MILSAGTLQEQGVVSGGARSLVGVREGQALGKLKIQLGCRLSGPNAGVRYSPAHTLRNTFLPVAPGPLQILFLLYPQHMSRCLTSRIPPGL